MEKNSYAPVSSQVSEATHLDAQDGDVNADPLPF
jgi:hypothetical protein